MEISKQLKQFEFELGRKGYRQNTIETYVAGLSFFLNHFKEKDSPKHISESDIKQFLYQYKQHNTQRSYHSAIKCYYKYVVKQFNKFKYIEYAKRSRRMPIILSVEEMGKIIYCASNIKHKTILCLMYSTGMRIGELINLKIKDIDSSRMIINIIDAKGGKDRIVTLDKNVLDLLRVYYKEYKPKEYLFNGQVELKYSERSVAQFFQKYANLAGIKKRVHPHLIRHCYATHLCENGLDLSIIKDLLGHSSIKTTEIYKHISHNHISKLLTPINFIIKGKQKLLAA